MSLSYVKILTVAQQWLCGKVMSPATMKILTCTTMALWQSYVTCNNENIAQCLCGKSHVTCNNENIAQQWLCGKIMSPATLKRYVGLNVKCLILQ
jgi:hypothetical protein